MYKLRLHRFNRISWFTCVLY